MGEACLYLDPEYQEYQELKINTELTYNTLRELREEVFTGIAQVKLKFDDKNKSFAEIENMKSDTEQVASKISKMELVHEKLVSLIKVKGQMNIMENKIQKLFSDSSEKKKKKVIDGAVMEGIFYSPQLNQAMCKFKKMKKEMKEIY